MSLLGGLGQAVGLGGAIGNIQNINPTQLQQIAAQRRVNVGLQSPAKPFNPNEIEAYQIPLSQLVTLWQAKYGDKWVELREVSDTEFFGHAADRLVRNALMEECRNWMRIKEGV